MFKTRTKSGCWIQKNVKKIQARHAYKCIQIQRTLTYITACSFMSSCRDKPFRHQHNTTCLKPQKTQRGLWSIKPQSLLQKEHSNSRSSDSSRRPVYVSIRLHPTNAYIWAFSMKAILAIHSFCFPNNTLSVCLWAGAAPLTDRTDFIWRKKG